MKLVLISDTHGQNSLLEDLPAGDVTIHCGDATRYGSREGLREFADIYSQAPSAVKILIAGNHDGCFQKHPEEARHIMGTRGIIYLEDSQVIIEGVKFWGMPWTPQYGNFSFMADGMALSEKWRAVPKDVDVLISHGPPKYTLDYSRGKHCGSEAHGAYITKARHLRLSVFGHIHSGYGFAPRWNTDCANCSLIDNAYQHRNRPIIYTVPIPYGSLPAVQD